MSCGCCLFVFVDLMLTVMEASNFTPSVYSVHALTLLAEVKTLVSPAHDRPPQNTSHQFYLFIFHFSPVEISQSVLDPIVHWAGLSQTWFMTPSPPLLPLLSVRTWITLWTNWAHLTHYILAVLQIPSFVTVCRLPKHNYIMYVVNTILLWNLWISVVW